MSEIDRQRIAAVSTLEALGYEFRSGRWYPTLEAAAGGTEAWPITGLNLEQSPRIRLADLNSIGFVDGRAVEPPCRLG